MPAKIIKKKPAVVKVPVTWLLAGALLLGTVMVAQAVNSNKQVAGINEIKTTGVMDQNYTGTVSREVANPNEKEKYILTTDAGEKYILIGLKKSYVDKETSEKMAKTTEEKAKAEKVTGKPVTSKPKGTPKSSPKADSEDVNSFEQYVGHKVTVLGLLVPVASEKSQKELLPAGSPQVKKAGGDQAVVQTDKTGKGVRPSVSPVPKASRQPTSGWDYTRLVVKSIAIVE